MDTSKVDQLRAGVSAKTAVVKVFKVYEDLDKEEGRGGRTLRYTLTSESGARFLSRGLGPQGSSGHIEPAEYLQLTWGSEAVYIPLRDVIEGEIPNTTKGALVAQALSKLTPDERAVLGYK